MALIDAVTKAMVKVHLVERDPALIDRVDGVTPMFDTLRTAVGVQVTVIVGTDPAIGPLRDLAMQAIAYEVASQFEYACFPEQQTAGNIGRGWSLHQRFLEMLTTLKGASSGTGVGALGSGQPSAIFPARTTTYPDPAE